MDKQKDTKQKFNINEIVKDNKTSQNRAGCSHYKRKAKFVVSYQKLVVEIVQKQPTKKEGKCKKFRK